MGLTGSPQLILKSLLANLIILESSSASLGSISTKNRQITYPRTQKSPESCHSFFSDRLSQPITSPAIQMPAFILAIFLSAFLLFQVQPIIARYILPWYGGSPAVWTTCMLFFQVGLLAGYSYAHLLVSRFRKSPRWQAGIHLFLLAVALLLLPITPSESLKPTSAEASPVGGIVLLLLVTVGLPYIVISASGPLLQHWFGAIAEGKSPYRLYAVSNFGSLLGLLTYPVLFEPNLRLGQQTGLWSGGFGIYAILAGVCAWIFLRSSPARSVSGDSAPSSAIAKPAPRIDWILWVALAACGSVLLLATTNQMCQDVAVVPFLWILPLSLYLITFIIAFDHARWYFRPFWIPLAAISIASLVYLLNQDFADTEMHLSIQIAIYATAMFSGCMVCHGEMVRLKPDPRYLTGFYLAVSLGGASGGVFVSLVAPRIFTSYWELHTGLVAVVVLSGFCLFRDLRKSRQRKELLIASGVSWIAALLVMGFFLRTHMAEIRDGAIAATRGFYGVLRVYEGDVLTEDHYRALYHGRISHGRQFFDDQFRHWPVTYYTANSGPGILFRYHPNRYLNENTLPMKFGVVGLGVGTLAAYAESGDTVRIYEINSQVEDLARGLFTYLGDCEGDESVVLGDARISLERELAAGESQQFDALFVDAFSGDSIPIHLLTREAFALYFEHLNPDGVLVVHITNLHLDLSDPVRMLAREFGKEAILVENDSDEYYMNYSAWVLITSNQEFLDTLREEDWVTPWYRKIPKEIHWTDDYCNLLEVIDWEN